MIGKLRLWAQLFFPTFLIFYVAFSQLANEPLDPWLILTNAIGMLAITISIRLHETYAGTMEVERFPDGSKRYSLGLAFDPVDLDKKSRIYFDVEASQD